MLKFFIQCSDGSVKGDWDVGIVFDGYELVQEVDIVVFVFGDGDFEFLVIRIV